MHHVILLFLPRQLTIRGIDLQYNLNFVTYSSLIAYQKEADDFIDIIAKPQTASHRSQIK